MWIWAPVQQNALSEYQIDVSFEICSNQWIQEQAFKHYYQVFESPHVTALTKAYSRPPWSREADGTIHGFVLPAQTPFLH